MLESLSGHPAAIRVAPTEQGQGMVTRGLVPVPRAPHCACGPWSPLHYGAWRCLPEQSWEARSKFLGGRMSPRAPRRARSLRALHVCVQLILCWTPSAPQRGKQLRRITPNKATLFSPLLPAEHCSPDSEPWGLPARSSFPYHRGPAAASPHGGKVGTTLGSPQRHSLVTLHRLCPIGCVHGAEAQQEG